MNMSLLEDDVVGKIYRADNIDVLRTLPSESVDPDLYRSSLQHRKSPGAHPTQDGAL
jgi:hypothetical protein